jgi:hypothetical protein
MSAVLLWRSFVPLHDFPATFSCLPHHGIGGTDTQLLWHARTLAELGWQVQVLGVSAINLSEAGVDFVGAKTRAEQEAHMRSGRVHPPDVVLFEGGIDAAPLVRQRFPKAKTIHIGQNIDNGGYRTAFGFWDQIDAYGFVGPGQYADYCQRFPKLRHKFLLVRNIVPWYWMHADLKTEEVADEIAWIGSWSKKGLRRWAVVMQRILGEFTTYHWALYGPSYGAGHGQLPPDLFKGLSLPLERIHVRSLPMAQMFEQLGRARLILVSLGNEAGPISILDAHAAARPVISGNDMVYKYANQDGTGIRVTNERQCELAVRHLLNDSELCDELGRRGQRLIIDQYTEITQRKELQAAIDYVLIKDRLRPLSDFRAWTHSRLEWEDFTMRVQRHFGSLLR